MAISKERKAELLQHYVELIKKSEGMIIIEYRGLNMKGMGPLRTKAREAAGELHVVKNTLALRALQEAGRPVPEKLFAQSSAIGFAFTDVPAMAKALTAYAKDSEFVNVKGALLGNSVLSPKEVESLGELPSLPVLRAQFLGLLSAPATRLAGVVASSVRQVVNVVKAYADKAPAGDAPVAEAPAAG